MPDQPPKSVEGSARQLAAEVAQLSALIVKMRRSDRWRWILLAPILLLLFAVVGQGIYFTREQDQLRDCQENVNAELRRVGKEDRSDYYSTWDAVLNSKSQAVSRDIFKQHLERARIREAARDKAELTRKKC